MSVTKFKKHNPGPEVVDAGPQQPMLPRELPALRTFVVRYNNADDDQIVEAHGVAFDEAGMVSFVIFFFLDGENRQQPAQANKLVLGPGVWLEVAEINPMFPVMEKH